MKERGLRCGAKSKNGSPLTGRKIVKLPRCPRGTVSAQSNYIQCNYIKDVTRIRVAGNKNMTVVDNNRETFSKKSGMTFCVFMMTKEVDENCYEGHREVKEEKLIF
jgi:hypothetical protein